MSLSPKYRPEVAAATGGSHKNARVFIDKVERSSLRSE
jgi:hypothetical protein